MFNISKSYEKTGNYEQAFEYFRITNNINSSNKIKILIKIIRLKQIKTDLIF